MYICLMCDDVGSNPIDLRISVVLLTWFIFPLAGCIGDTSSTFGSQRSLWSSLGTFQGNSMKNICGKGVDGQVFKDRMEVSVMYMYMYM